MLSLSGVTLPVLLLLLALLTVLIYYRCFRNRCIVMKADDYEEVGRLVERLTLNHESGIIFFACGWHRRGVNADLWAELWYLHLKDGTDLDLVAAFNAIVDEFSLDMTLMPTAYEQYGAACREIAPHYSKEPVGELVKAYGPIYKRIFPCGVVQRSKPCFG